MAAPVLPKVIGGGTSVTTWMPPVSTPALLPAMGAPGQAHVVLDDGDGKTAIYVWNPLTIMWEKVADPDFSASGDVSGPAGATSNTIVVFDGSTGKLIKEATGFIWNPIGSRIEDPSGDPLISDTQHAALRQLIHLADGSGPFEEFASGAYKEVLPVANPFPTSVIWYESVAKTEKIVEKTITYNGNKTPATITWEAYDTDGTTVLATVSDTISYSGVFETSRTRTVT